MDLLGVYEYTALLMVMMKGSIIIGAQARAKVLEGEKGSFAEVSGRNRRLPYLCVDQVRAVTSLCFFPLSFTFHITPQKLLDLADMRNAFTSCGPFTNTVEGVTFKEDIRVVQGMILRYMKKPRSTMLAVVPK
uniref:Uncharacterized protein n=1 Tax=Coccidioides posadasii RMSCC 3488 TaxID=454284 RepID=A0A0J6FGB3_COCPO|nr:hypothetical protein CPAG_08460 [Coccidioides posadasii RMSCC 3488]